MSQTSSPVDAIGPAIEHVRRVLFRPFDVGRWVTLGFLSFLQVLPQILNEARGSYNGFEFPGGRRHHLDGGEGIRQVAGWISENLPLVALLGFFAILVLLVVVVLFLWLSARGTFCYLDCIATNRAEVARPWREHREIADSLFFWRLVFSLVLSVILILLLAPVGISMWRLATSGQELTFWTMVFGTSFILMIVPLSLVGLTAVIVRTLLIDFVAPVQYLRRIRCSEAFGIVWGLFQKNFLMFVVYLLLRLVLYVLFSIGIVLLGCATCCICFCIMLIPVLGQALLQPMFVFTRSFPLFFLRGYGPEFDVFAPGALTGGGPPGGVPVAPPPGPSPSTPSPIDWKPTGEEGTKTEPREPSEPSESS